MKALAFFFLFCFFTLTSWTQTRTVRGVVFDKISGARISGVKITPDFFGNDTTDSKGRFHVYLPKKYQDTITLTHRNYYPFILKINNASPRIIYMIPKSVLLDTLFYEVFDGNEMLYGRVFDFNTRKGIENVVFKTLDEKKVGYSGKEGKFDFVIPVSTGSLIVSHNDYKTDTAIVTDKDFTSEFPVFMHAEHPKTNHSDRGGYYRNLLWIPLNELFNVSFGLSYVRFLKKNHAVGLKGSYYMLLKRPIPFSTSNKYSGVKLSFVYRGYLQRNMSNQSFVEGKITGGYFDFEKFVYSQGGLGEDFISRPLSFSTFGLGINWGYEDIIKGSKHLVFGFSMGFQYFPLNTSTTYIDENNIEYIADNWWWYLYGPGSVFEIKIYLGGIF